MTEVLTGEQLGPPARVDPCRGDARGVGLLARLLDGLGPQLEHTRGVRLDVLAGRLELDLERVAMKIERSPGR